MDVKLRDYPTSFVRTVLFFATIWYYYTLIQIVLSSYTHDYYHNLFYYYMDRVKSSKDSVLSLKYCITLSIKLFFQLMNTYNISALVSYSLLGTKYHHLNMRYLCHTFLPLILENCMATSIFLLSKI